MNKTFTFNLDNPWSLRQLPRNSASRRAHANKAEQHARTLGLRSAGTGVGAPHYLRMHVHQPQTRTE
jgi:hypothetical protein